jgi:hsp70-interacting protein
MESLLRWSIENAATDGSGPRPPPEPRKDLDPGIIDAILGKPDAVLMKVCSLSVCLDIY